MEPSSTSSPSQNEGAPLIQPAPSSPQESNSSSSSSAEGSDARWSRRFLHKLRYGSNFSWTNCYRDCRTGHFSCNSCMSLFWKAINHHFHNLFKDAKRDSYYKINRKHFRREHFQWILLLCLVQFNFLISISVGGGFANGAAITAAFLDLFLFFISLDVLFVTFENPNKYTQEEMLKKKEDLEAQKTMNNEEPGHTFSSLKNEPLFPDDYIEPFFQKIAGLVLAGIIVLCELIFVGQLPAFFFFFGVHVGSTVLIALMPFFVPLIISRREQLDFPAEIKEKMKYLDLATHRYFSSDWLMKGAEQPMGTFSKQLTRLHCFHVATDDIQLTNYRAVLVRTHHGNVWNCYRPDFQDYVTSWLPKVPSLLIVEPATYCCCYTTLNKMDNRMVCNSCCDPCGCNMLDSIECYDHGPCCPSKHVIIGEEGNLNFKIVIDTVEEKKLVARFYEVTENWNGVYTLNKKHFKKLGKAITNGNSNNGNSGSDPNSTNNNLVYPAMFPPPPMMMQYNQSQAYTLAEGEEDESEIEDANVNVNNDNNESHAYEEIK